MAFERDHFERVICVGGSAIRLRCRPRGSELCDLVGGPRSTTPIILLRAVLRAVGWLLHVSIFRCRWSVSADSVGPPSTSTRLLRLRGLTEHEAKQTFAALTRSLETDTWS